MARKDENGKSDKVRRDRQGQRGTSGSVEEEAAEDSATEERPALVTYDAAADGEAARLDGFAVIGHVVHRNASPSFTDIAALLEPQHEVKPGQFLGMWHGRRNRHVLT